jgi:Vacuolar protein sorting-associated protein 35
MPFSRCHSHGAGYPCSLLAASISRALDRTKGKISQRIRAVEEARESRLAKAPSSSDLQQAVGRHDSLLMNSNNSIASLDTHGEDGTGGWGTMGEDGGFGRENAPSQSFVQSPPPVVTATPDMYSAAAPQSQGGYISQFATTTAAAPVTLSPHHSMMQSSSSPYGGSQTHGYAAPMGNLQPYNSFAARSQQAYTSEGSLQAQQYAGTQIPTGGSMSATGNSYAQRSHQAYGGVSPMASPPPNPQTAMAGSGYATTPMNSSGGSDSYAARSQQVSQGMPPPPPQPQPTGIMYGGSSGSVGGSVVHMPQQAYQGQPTASAAPAGSYAARSTAATLYGGQQQPMMQQQQQQSMGNYSVPQQQFPQPTSQFPHTAPMSQSMAPPGGNMTPYVASSSPPVFGLESTQQQQKILTDATRKVQEHAYYMKQAMEQPHINNLAVVLDRAAHMVGELGGPPHGGPSGGAAAGVGGGNVGPTNTGGSAKLTPKNYYELYMRALEDMPALEEYLIQLASRTETAAQPLPGMIRIVADASQIASAETPQPKALTMRELYECVQYCPRVVSRLYLQIAAGSALIRSGECGAKWVMQDLQQGVKCEQNPVRGLFLRNFLLTALRDKLPDTPPLQAQKRETVVSGEAEGSNDDGKNDDDSAANYDEFRSSSTAMDENEKGTVKDSYEFVLANFMEMNKLWVRIQHLPGEGNNKDVRKRRERERNDLRILVGTNLVRLSQLECVTSQIYGEAILPRILDHIVTTGDPLSQAYLMDCLVQVFPDEYHIETLPILLNVCPRLRDKVNIRTILQGLMDRLAKYLAEEELLDESDTNQVKKVSTGDSFNLFDECVQKVYNARGPRLTHKEVIRLQTALLQFSIKCFPGNMEQVSHCISNCVAGLRQASAYHDVVPGGTTQSTAPQPTKILDDASVVELEKLLSIPLDSLSLKVLELEQYSHLIGFLPWVNRREVAIAMLKAVENSGPVPMAVKDLEQLFKVIEPLVRDEFVGTNVNVPSGGVNGQQIHQQYASGMAPHVDPTQLQKTREENVHVSKLIHSIDHEHSDIVYEMLKVARNQILHPGCNPRRVGDTLAAVIYKAFKLAQRVFATEYGPSPQTDTPSTSTPSNNPSASPQEGETGGETPNAKPEGSVSEESQAESSVQSVRSVFWIFSSNWVER